MKTTVRVPVLVKERGQRSPSFSLLMTLRMTLPKRMFPMFECPSSSLKYSTRPCHRSDNGEPWTVLTQLELFTMMATSHKLFFRSGKLVPLPNDTREDRCLQNAGIGHWVIRCSFRLEAPKASEMNYEYLISSRSFPRVNSPITA